MPRTEATRLILNLRFNNLSYLPFKHQAVYFPREGKKCEMGTASPVCHSTVVPVLHAMMKRHVNYDSPTTFRAVSISGKFLSNPGACHRDLWLCHVHGLVFPGVFRLYRCTSDNNININVCFSKQTYCFWVIIRKCLVLKKKIYPFVYVSVVLVSGSTDCQLDL